MMTLIKQPRYQEYLAKVINHTPKSSGSDLRPACTHILTRLRRMASVILISDFYIPDFYIPSLNLIVEIKSSENGHYRARDIETEKLKDAAIEKTNYTYIKVFDKKYDEFVNYVQAAEPARERNIEES